MQKPYEVFEHTADVGLHAYGSTLSELFIHAAQGMESLMVAPEQVRALVSREIAATGHDDVAESRVQGRAFGEPYDARRHELSSAIKAVTWHEAAVERTGEGYRASIIFDI